MPSGILAHVGVETTSNVESCVIGISSTLPKGLVCWFAVVAKLLASIWTGSSAPCCNNKEQTELLCVATELLGDSSSGTTIFEGICWEPLWIWGWCRESEWSAALGVSTSSVKRCSTAWALSFAGNFECSVPGVLVLLSLHMGDVKGLVHIGQSEDGVQSSGLDKVAAELGICHSALPKTSAKSAKVRSANSYSYWSSFKTPLAFV